MLSTQTHRGRNVSYVPSADLYAIGQCSRPASRMVLTSHIRADDRGLQYGDGLFETLRCVSGQAPFLDWHRQRLSLGCERLGLPQPDLEHLREQLRQAVAGQQHTLVKLILTAGSGPRGYARPSILTPCVLLQVQPLKIGTPADLALRWCELKLARQPALAGIKHLNRLEQVLARNEWNTDEFDEGLMLDSEDQVICATAANVFIRTAGQWLTPPVEVCGVAGIGRRWMLERGAQVRELSVADVGRAEQCLLTNAVRGPRAAISLESRRYVPDEEVRALQWEWEQCFTASFGSKASGQGPDPRGSRASGQGPDPRGSRASGQGPDPRGSKASGQGPDPRGSRASGQGPDPRASS